MKVVLHALLWSQMWQIGAPKYAYLGAYLGAPNMVKWGVPEKILQNAV